MASYNPNESILKLIMSTRPSSSAYFEKFLSLLPHKCKDCWETPIDCYRLIEQRVFRVNHIITICWKGVAFGWITQSWIWQTLGPGAMLLTFLSKLKALKIQKAEWRAEEGWRRLCVLDQKLTIHYLVYMIPCCRRSVNHFSLDDINTSNIGNKHIFILCISPYLFFIFFNFYEPWWEMGRVLRAHGASCHSEVSVGRQRVPLGRHQRRKHRSLPAINL